MRLFKWILSFSAAFLVAWVVIFTFIQPPFKTRVPAKILRYETPAIPVYLYVAGAFGAGIVISGIIGFAYFLGAQTKTARLKRQVRDLSIELEELRRTLPQEHAAEDPVPPDPQEEEQAVASAPAPADQSDEAFLDNEES